MPGEYSIPPWLRATDTTTPYLSGVKEGAGIAEEHAQLQANIAMQQQKLQLQQQEDAQAAQQYQQQLAEKQQETQRQFDLDQQRLKIQDAYQQRQTGLKQQAVQDAHQKLQMASQSAAQQYSAMQSYQEDAQNPDIGPEKAAIKWGPMMSKSGAVPQSVIDSAQRRVETQAPVTTEPLTDPATGATIPGKVVATINGRKAIVNDPSYEVGAREKAAATKAEQSQKSAAQREAKKALADFLKANSAWAPALTTGDTSTLGPEMKKQFPAIKAQYDALKAAASGQQSETQTSTGTTSDKDPLGLFK